jgi:hypothetical protein
MQAWIANIYRDAIIILALMGRHLATMLGELEETPIPQKVDLLLKKTLRHQELLHHIERVGVVFYDRETGQA